MLLILSVAPASAEDAFKPIPTLVMDVRAALGIEPQEVIVSGKFAYVLGVNANGASEIEMRDTGSLELIASKAFTFSVEDIAADPSGDAVYMIGNNRSATRFQVLDPKLNPLGSLTIKRRIGHPALTTAPDKTVAISGLRTEYSDGYFAAVDVGSLSEPMLRDFFVSGARGGVMNGWIDVGFGAMFLNSASDSRLLAVATGKSYVMSEFGVQTASGVLGEPYAIAAQIGHDACRGDQPTSFLVADMTRNILSLVDFDEAFQSLDMLSFVEFNLSPTRATLGLLEGTSMREPAALISASCDQSVIFLGSKTSYEVAQFARNQDLNSLERVGTIKLPGRPNDIVVDRTGDFAIAVSSENRAIMRFVNESAENPGDRVIGDANVRELQRTLTEIGIPVGTIDGIMGTKTMRAVSLAERRFGVELDPTRDVIKSIETLKRALPLK
ncbi:MAG: peptidoglycan-binding protein [Paracoccaceae bacterium]